MPSPLAHSVIGVPVDTGVPADAPGAANAVVAVGRHRARIDEIDRQLIGLIEQRMALSSQVQATRMSTGGPALAPARETQIISHYRATLGDIGAEAALLILRLSRGGGADEQ
ncbi:chorismate mutase [Streptomyces sp. NBC_01410]|uniref:chorismate mutase n=1 Tax=Streptomyces sp. NBC_01410 TaxID=2903856 RepID=UPI00324718CA